MRRAARLAPSNVAVDCARTAIKRSYLLLLLLVFKVMDTTLFYSESSANSTLFLGCGAASPGKRTRVPLDRIVQVKWKCMRVPLDEQTDGRVLEVRIDLEDAREPRHRRVACVRPSL
jgi:hypothetical protein